MRKFIRVCRQSKASMHYSDEIAAMSAMSYYIWYTDNRVKLLRKRVMESL